MFLIHLANFEIKSLNLFSLLLILQKKYFYFSSMFLYFETVFIMYALIFIILV